MRLFLVSKNKLTDAQAQHLSERLADPEHQNDNGTIRVWNWDAFQPSLYAFINNESVMPIAIADASGHPIATAGWWIDSQFRRQGYGSELVDLLAQRLKADGVTGIGHIRIDTYRGCYDAQSSKLVQRLRGYFS